MTTSAGISESVYLAGVSSTKLEDFGTIPRPWRLGVRQLPAFVTAGLAIGRAEVTDQVAIQNYGYDAKTYSAN